MSDTKQFTGTKTVNAKYMNRKQYNDFRGWSLPADEDGSDEGFLIEDVNGASNVDGYDGYVSWSPLALFKQSYNASETPLERMLIEGMQLVQRLKDLKALLAKPQPSFISDKQWSLLQQQLQYMDNYFEVLNERIEGLSVEQECTDRYAGKFVPCTAPKDPDHGLTDEEIKRLAETGSLCDCQYFEIDGTEHPIKEGDLVDFGTAIHLMKLGNRVQRAGWNGKGMFLYYVPAASYPMQRNSLETMGGIFPDDMVPYGAYIAMKTAQDNVVPWLASQTDVLAEDWQLA